jgi:hypothetical protein
MDVSLYFSKGRAYLRSASTKSFETWHIASPDGGADWLFSNFENFNKHKSYGREKYF